MASNLKDTDGKVDKVASSVDAHSHAIVNINQDMNNNHNEILNMLRGQERERQQNIERQSNIRSRVADKVKARAITESSGASPQRKSPRNGATPEKSQEQASAWGSGDNTHCPMEEEPEQASRATAVTLDGAFRQVGEDDEFGGPESQEEKEQWDSHPAFSKNKESGAEKDGAAKDN